MRVLILGATGQLGGALLRRLGSSAVPAGRERADLMQPDSLRRILDEERPDAVINCAAYNLVDRAESEPHSAFAVNAVGVRELALECGRRGLYLVHFSTDYVFGFDEGRRHPYTETDLPGPLSVYGVSKLAGENFVQAHCPSHLVIRTCGLYGLPGVGGKAGNFVEAMLRLAQAGQTIRVKTDEICSPTYTVDLAEATVALLERRVTGLLHVTSSGQCSRFEFAEEIFRQASLRPNLVPVTSAEYGSPARRPFYAVLSLEKFRSLGFPPLPEWRDALSRYLRERHTLPAG